MKTIAALLRHSRRFPDGAVPRPAFDSQQLDQMVASIALHPDPLLARILTASTFSGQIPDADGWARAHSYLTGDALARAINEDNLPGSQYRVVTPGPRDIEILPVNPLAIYVPYYDPNVVFSRRDAGFFVRGAITFGSGIFVNAFALWGWEDHTRKKGPVAGACVAVDVEDWRPENRAP